MSSIESRERDLHEKLTRLQRENEALREQIARLEENTDQRFKNIFNMSLDGIFICDPNGRYLDVNSSASKITGYTREELLSLNLADLIPKDDRNKGRERFKTVKESGFFGGEARFLRKDGTIGNWILSSIRLDNNTFLAFVKDISERINTEEKLRESAEKYRLLFENMTVGFALHEMIYDENGDPLDYRYLEINPAFEKLTGIQASSLKGHTIKEIVPNIEQHWIETFGTVAKTGIPISYENFAEEFGKIYDTWVFCPAKDHFAVVFSDITDRRKAEEALKESEAALSAVINNRNEAIWSIDREYNYMIMNHYFLNDYKTAFNLDLKKGDNVFSVIPDELREFWKEKYDAALSGSRQNFEFSAQLNGLNNFFNVSLNPIYTMGEITGVSCISMNITERKKTESELEIYRNKLEELVNERTKKLEESEKKLQNHNKEIEAFNSAMVDRELRIIEMKKEVNQLCIELGRKIEYQEFWK